MNRATEQNKTQQCLQCKDDGNVIFFAHTISIKQANPVRLSHSSRRLESLMKLLADLAIYFHLENKRVFLEAYIHLECR